jgi:TetR/AcrR family transcriptional regulator, repressor for neighboring sulfatase
VSRERRTPDQARSLILDAAERVFTRVMPDQVGLRDIAREAGISHALVTHYFGTYEGLARATLERRIGAARQQAITRLGSATFTPGNMPLLEILLEVIEDPVMLRLVGWALLSGREDAMSSQPGALAPVLDAIEARARALGLPAPSRPQLEFSVAAALALAFGLSVARAELERALDRPGALSLEALRTELPKMVWAYLTAHAGRS